MVKMNQTEKPFRCSRVEYLELMEEHFHYKDIVETIFFNYWSTDQLAEFIENICRLNSIPCPDQVTEQDLFYVRS